MHPKKWARVDDLYSRLPIMNNLFNSALIVAVLACVDPIPASAQTGALNDTGMNLCFTSNSGSVPCNEAAAGNAGINPHQDGRYGRDPAQIKGALAKVGAGPFGFDFTRICWNGSPEGTTSGPNLCTGTLVANTTGAPRATATDWACTRDNVTGLTWSLQSQSANWSIATGAAYPNAGHNTPARCGLPSGWRVPRIQELVNLTHYGQSGLLDPAYFPATEFERYWAAESYTPFSPTSLAWALFHHELGVPQQSIKSNSRFVRLVYSESPPPLQTYTNNADKTVTDNLNGLIWDRCVIGLSGDDCTTGAAQSFAWAAALQEVTARNNANHLGYNDWRLPNFKELFSLLKINGIGMLIDTVYFPNTPRSMPDGSDASAATLWSSTVSSNTPAQAWARLVNFETGFSSAYRFRTETYRIRLVRGGSGFTAYDSLAPLACNLDIDGDSARTAEIDGVLLLRYLLGFRGDALISGFTLTGSRNTAALIEPFIGDAKQYEVFGRAATTPEALRDGLVIVRLMLAVPDVALLTGIEVPAGAVYTAAAAVRQAVNAACGTIF
jgi:Protein of unknown function (DUF1566)